MTRENIKENRQLYGELKIRKGYTLEKNFLKIIVLHYCHVLSGAIP